jgi:hypothetical protein
MLLLKITFSIFFSYLITVHRPIYLSEVLLSLQLLVLMKGLLYFFNNFVLSNLLVRSFIVVDIATLLATMHNVKIIFFFKVDFYANLLVGTFVVVAIARLKKEEFFNLFSKNMNLKSTLLVDGGTVESDVALVVVIARKQYVIF